jgi:acetylornithine deacetylase/succinyl-diaminopimelate desuccinylase-like protein
MSGTATDRALERIDEDRLVELALDLGNIDSPPGREQGVSDRVFTWLGEQGIEAAQIGMFPDRQNVVGRLRGDGSRPSVVLNAHMDTAWGPDERRWMHHPDDPVYTSAWREGDRLWGNGVVNDKGPLACSLIALRAVNEAAVPLGGDVTVIGVCGEIGQEPVDEFESPHFLSKEVGTRYAVEHGAIADFAVVAENTDFGVTTVEAGKAFFKITVLGDRSAYTPYVRHTIDPTEHANAIVRAAPVIEWLTRWGRRYEEEHTYEFEYGSCVPKVSIGAIRAGQPFMPIVSAERCYLYLDVRLTPAQTAMDVDRELRRGLGTLDVPLLVECTLYRRGYEAVGAQPLLGALESAHRAEFGRPLGGVRPGQASSWRDTNPYNELGIPAVSYGPSAGKGGAQSWTAIPDLVHAARMYVRVMVGMSATGSPTRD